MTDRTGGGERGDGGGWNALVSLFAPGHRANGERRWKFHRRIYLGGKCGDLSNVAPARIRSQPVFNSYSKWRQFSNSPSLSPRCCNCLPFNWNQHCVIAYLVSPHKNALKVRAPRYEVTIHTLPHLECIRLVSFRWSHLRLKCICLFSVRSSLPCINAGVRIKLVFSKSTLHWKTSTF